MKSYEFITEAKPENLGQNKLDQIFSTYQKRDSRDNTLPQKFNNGLEVANYIFQFVGPNNLIWVTNQYIKDQYFFLHDLPQWKTTLEEFVKVTRSSRIQINKDVNSYNNISELRKALDMAKGRSEELGSKFYSKSISSVQEFVNKNEAKWLYRSNDYSIYQPLTFESSNICKNFNISVSACTIMNDDSYDEYIGNGSLIYIIDQSNVYICYISNDIEEQESEFSDADNDHAYNLEWQFNKFPALRPILEKIKIDPNDLQVNMLLAKTDEETLNIALNAVKQNANALYYVPDRLKTPELCLLAVKLNGYALHHVPDELKTPEMCMIAVKHYGDALEAVPDELKTPEMCMISVNKNGYALEDVPKELKTPELCLIAVKRNGGALEMVPDEYKTYELCLIAVKNNAGLHHVPDELITPDIYLAAVKNNAWTLLDVPDEYKTPEMCLAAVKQDVRLIRHVPDELKDTVIKQLRNNNAVNESLTRIKELIGYIL
jgi:hypothetical protein